MKWPGTISFKLRSYVYDSDPIFEILSNLSSIKVATDPLQEGEYCSVLGQAEVGFLQRLLHALSSVFYAFQITDPFHHKPNQDHPTNGLRFFK